MTAYWNNLRKIFLAGELLIISGKSYLFDLSSSLVSLEVLFRIQDSPFFKTGPEPFPYQ